jgi:hypothetical protein
MFASVRFQPNSPRRRSEIVVIAGLFVVMAVGAIALLAFKLQRQPAFVDYLVMWTGGRFAHSDPGALYDFVRIDRGQAWLLGSRAHDRPFPYPPSALLVFEPLARLPFWPSAWVWSIGGAALFAAGTWRLAAGRPRLVLALTWVMPGVVWAALSGQCAFLVGGLAMLAIVGLDRRAIAAGVALGLAAMLKPTLLLMVPVALIAGGYWRTLLAAGVTCAAVMALSIALWGLGPWIDWLTVAPDYLARIAADPRYRTAIIAPTGLAIGLGAAAWPLTVCRIGFAVAGVALAAGVFRRGGASPALRLVAVIGGSLLATPYAMSYETALLAPVAALGVIEASGRPRFWLAVVGYLALALAGLPNIGAFAFPIFLVLALWPTASASIDFPRKASDLRVE